MKIVEKKLSELIPYENNPRLNDEAVPLVEASIREFGFKVPIICDKKNVIVAGHTRYKAALNLGMETVPCIVADDLTPKQIKAFRLADNKVSEIARWDFEKLDLELEEIDMDMSAFGFTEGENADGEYIDDFFDRGNEAKVQEPKYEVRVECKNEIEQNDAYKLLKEAGYNPVML